MTERIMYWASVFLGLLGLMLLITNAALIEGNRTLQKEINDRQVIINNASAAAPLNQNLAQALAEVSVKNKDMAIRDLLVSQGITLRDAEKTDGAKPDPAKKK